MLGVRSSSESRGARMGVMMGLRHSSESRGGGWGSCWGSDTIVKAEGEDGS